MPTCKRSLGIVHHSFFGALYRLGDAEALHASVLRTLEDDRFRSIEVDYVADARAQEALRAAISQTLVGIAVSSGTAMNRSGLSLCSIDHESHRASVQKAKEIIDFCCLVGARTLVLPPGKDPGETGRSEALRCFLESMQELWLYNERASRGRLVLTIEQMDRDFHHKHLLGPTSETLGALDALRRSGSGAKLTFDTSHVAQLREDPLAALRSSRDVIHQIHLANCVMGDQHSAYYGDKHPPFGVEAGVFDEAYLAAFLAEAGRLGLVSEEVCISLEINTPPGHDPWLALAEAKRALFGAWHRADLT